MTIEHGLELRSQVTSAGELELSLVEVPVPRPGPDQVLIRVEAAPINPSDLALLIGPADLATLRRTGNVTVATIPEGRRGAVAGRLDQSLAVGNEGAGTVIEAGANAQALGSMFAQYKVAKAVECLVLPDGASARDGASSVVNPLTSLGFVETMKREGHTAIVHTAAASNLGQMLVRVCAKDGIPLVNVVRSPEQVALLRELGAVHVVDSTSPTFLAELTEALTLTKATIAFDAITGGPLANQILIAMETAISRGAMYSRYGSAVHKQLYCYGHLDLRPTELTPLRYGLAWGIGGWLLTPFLMKAGLPEIVRLRARVMAELTTTFASHYSAEITLAQALEPETVVAYSKRATGSKYLIKPQG
jgi:NADPH:quinone reductase-like Zn-dependent oxidoreductase